jgi:O-antigen ligase
MGAITIYFTFNAIGPRAFRRISKALASAAFVIAVISVSPLGEQLIKVLPFMGGTLDSGSVTYRQALVARSWELIQENPFFGDKFVLDKMEDLRQGVGLIDLVNTYAEVALFNGLIGLSLFLGFILLGLAKAYRSGRATIAYDPQFAMIGFNLVSCIVGTLLMIGTCSFILGYVKLFYVFGGWTAAYSYLSKTNNTSPNSALSDRVTYGSSRLSG